MNTHPNSTSPARSNSVSLSSVELQGAVQAIVEHLRRESEYLDTVIACSINLKDLLNRPTVADRKSAASSQSATSFERLADLRGDLARQFLPVHEGRRQLQSTLQSFEPLFDAPPTLRQLATQLANPVRDELNQLRQDIKTKLRDVQAITMGNQAVLIYTLDFYHRLISGITGESSAPQAYNALGQFNSAPSSSLIQQEC